MFEASGTSSISLNSKYLRHAVQGKARTFAGVADHMGKQLYFHVGSSSSRNQRVARRRLARTSLQTAGTARVSAGLLSLIGE